jgi:hypothetical protein
MIVTPGTLPYDFPPEIIAPVGNPEQTGSTLYICHSRG